VFVDEVSFASREFIEKLNDSLKSLLQEKTKAYGGMRMIFSGDFSQLPPVGRKPLFVYRDFMPWFDWVN
jgi:ATP-dependent DNA helicase PIF1